MHAQQLLTRRTWRLDAIERSEPVVVERLEHGLQS
jgi:hypothetical protein